MIEARIVFKIERNVVLEPLWFDTQWFNELLEDGLSQQEALLKMVKTAVEEDPLSVLWETFGPGTELPAEFVASITKIGLEGAAR